MWKIRIAFLLCCLDTKDQETAVALETIWFTVANVNRKTICNSISCRDRGILNFEFYPGLILRESERLII